MVSECIRAFSFLYGMCSNLLAPRKAHVCLEVSVKSQAQLVVAAEFKLAYRGTGRNKT